MGCRSIKRCSSCYATTRLGASSIAGQALVQAMESALPIAQADASTQASFEAQNLSNRQQRAMLALNNVLSLWAWSLTKHFKQECKICTYSDIANMNFTAEQQVQLENSRIANTMNLNNLKQQTSHGDGRSRCISKLRYG